MTFSTASCGQSGGPKPEVNLATNPEEAGRVALLFTPKGSSAPNVEQWSNICLIVRELLNGSSVDDGMAMFDALQTESLAG